MERKAQNSTEPKKASKAKNTYQVELLPAGTQTAREVLKEFIWQKIKSGGLD